MVKSQAQVSRSVWSMMGWIHAHPDLQENLDFSFAFDTQFDSQDGNHKPV